MVHEVEPLQRLPHVPQFALSDGTHALPHRSVPVGQPHMPLLHNWPAAHVRPQPPQFCTSSVSRMQRLLQFVVPLGHWHWLLKQFAPLPQTLPHAPQLLGSNCVMVHESPHCA